MLTVLNRWKTDFCNLFNSDNTNKCDFMDTRDLVDDSLDQNISILKVVKAVQNAKLGKASGVDCIPAEVLKNDSSVLLLHSLFNVCFLTGQVLTLWSRSIINPIPKSSSNDKRDPLSYRGISLAATMYKIYSSILNKRTVKWTDSNGIIAKEQNVFRKERSTVNHSSCLTNVIDTHKTFKLSRFCAFIDFRKALDSVNRNLLRQKLANNGHC